MKEKTRDSSERKFFKGEFICRDEKGMSSPSLEPTEEAFKWITQKSQSLSDKGGWYLTYFKLDILKIPGEFPGSPVVSTRCFQCQGPGWIPGQGTKIPQAMWHGQKKKKKKIHNTGVWWDRVGKERVKVQIMPIFPTAKPQALSQN